MGRACSNRGGEKTYGFRAIFPPVLRMHRSGSSQDSAQVISLVDRTLSVCFSHADTARSAISPHRPRISNVETA